jgi:hypothetical protein
MNRINKIVFFTLLAWLTVAVIPAYSGTLPEIIYLRDGSTIETDGAFLSENWLRADNSFVPYYKGKGLVYNVEIIDVDLEKTFGERIQQKYFEVLKERYGLKSLLAEH